MVASLASCCSESVRSLKYRANSYSWSLVITPESSVNPNGEPEDATGSWQSIHVFEASERGRSAHYKLTSTVMLELVTKGEGVGDVKLSGSLTRQVRWLSATSLEAILTLYRTNWTVPCRMRHLISPIPVG